MQTKGVRYWLLFCILFLSGCASIRGSTQYVLIQSDQAGDKVYQNGELIGTSPGFMPVRRLRRPEITFVAPNGSRSTKPLKTSYRWGGSFAGNLVFLTLAPVGWAFDLITGSAWYVEPPMAADTKQLQLLPKKIAIAPIEGVDREFSAVLGYQIEAQIRRERIGKSNWDIQPYVETEPIFYQYSDDPGIPEKQSARGQLFNDLKVSDIVLAKATPTAEGFVVRGKYLNVFTGQESSPFTLNILARDKEFSDQLKNYAWWDKYFRLLPNTVFLNYVSGHPQATFDEQGYEGKYIHRPGFGNLLLDNISAISLVAIERPMRGMRGKWKFGFVPTFIASKRQIEFDAYPPLRDVKFERTILSAGYGIEFGYMSRFGYAYGVASPMVSWTDLDYRGPTGRGEAQHTAVTVLVELGYQYFLTDHFVLKAFSRSYSEDEAAWQKAIRKASNSDAVFGGVTNLSSGIAIGYYFPSSFSRLKQNWKVQHVRANP